MEAAQPGRTINNHAALIWSIADLLRGDYKQSEYGRVILPVLWFEQVLTRVVATPAQDATA